MRFQLWAAAMLIGVGIRPALSSAETVTVLAGPIAPYAIERGDKPGAAVEIVNEMAKRAGIAAVVKFEPWARAQADAQSGHDVAILPLTRTPERESKYTWIVPLLSDQLYLQTIRTDLDIPSLAKAGTLSIATLRNTPQEDLLRQAGLSKLELVNDEDAGAKMLKAGHVDAWFTRGMVASFTYAQNGGDPKQLVRSAETETPPMYLGGSPDFPKATAEKLSQALASMKADGSYDRILQAYR